MRFRPCIDLRNGRVVQIVGGSLRDGTDAGVQVNFTSERGAAEYARRYRDDDLPGGHVVALGPGNREAAFEALAAFPGGMHYGGGVTPDNAGEFLRAGASHVIVTSYVFRGGRIDMERLERLVDAVGRRQLVLDLSCRWKKGAFHVMADRWQTFTEETVDEALLDRLADYCDEFLVHGVDVEGTRQGIQEELVELLGRISPLPVTYAGGVTSLADFDRVNSLGRGRVDLTIGSALDLFGGTIPYRRVLEWQRAHGSSSGEACT